MFPRTSLFLKTMSVTDISEVWSRDSTPIEELTTKKKQKTADKETKFFRHPMNYSDALEAGIGRVVIPFTREFIL